MVQNICNLQLEIEKSKSLLQYFSRNHLFSLKKIAEKKLKKQENKYRRFINHQLWFLNREIGKRKQCLQNLSLSRIKLTSHLYPRMSMMYKRMHDKGHF
jgi:hypothetical protein